MHSRPIVVAESKIFERIVDSYMTRPELEAFKFFIAHNPEEGDVIKGSGGVRKIRWRGDHGGKSSGVRVIYYYMNKNHPIYLLTVYPKSLKDDLSHADIAAMKSLVKLIKRDASYSR